MQFGSVLMHFNFYRTHWEFSILWVSHATKTNHNSDYSKRIKHSHHWQEILSKWLINRMCSSYKSSESRYPIDSFEQKLLFIRMQSKLFIRVRGRENTQHWSEIHEQLFMQSVRGSILRSKLILHEGQAEWMVLWISMQIIH